MEPYEFGPVGTDVNIWIPADEKILLAYQNRNDGNKGYLTTLGTVSGTSITFGDGTKYSDNGANQNNAVYDPDQQNGNGYHF